MLLRIIHKEILLNILSARFLVTYGLLMLLVGLAVALMSGEYTTRMQEYSTQVSKQAAMLDEIEDIEDPAQQFQQLQRSTLYGARPPRDLGILVRGVEDDLPSRVASNSFFLFSSSEFRLNRDVLLEVFQTPDFAYVVNIVMSLLAMLFVFDSISGEKERGTLKLLLANSVPRDLVILGKWIGGYLSITLPFLVAVLGGFVYMYVEGSFDMDGGGIERAALIVLVSLLYMSTFFSLGLMISAVTHRNATSLLVSLLVWIGWILIVPNLAPVVAGLISPAPSRQMIDTEIRVIDEEFRLVTGTASRRNTLNRQEQEQRQQETEARKDKLEAFYRDKTNAQIDLGQNLARLSPSACSLFAMTRLAGTGPDLFGHFHRALTRFQEQSRDYTMDFWQAGRIEWTPNGMSMKDPNWFNRDDLPRFRVHEETLSDSIDAALPDILLLLVYNALFFMLAYVFFLRYDVT